MTLQLSLPAPTAPASRQYPHAAQPAGRQAYQRAAQAVR